MFGVKGLSFFSWESTLVIGVKTDEKSLESWELPEETTDAPAVSGKSAQSAAVAQLNTRLKANTRPVILFIPSPVALSIPLQYFNGNCLILQVEFK